MIKKNRDNTRLTFFIVGYALNWWKLVIILTDVYVGKNLSLSIDFAFKSSCALYFEIEHHWTRIACSLLFNYRPEQRLCRKWMIDSLARGVVVRLLLTLQDPAARTVSLEHCGSLFAGGATQVALPVTNKKKVQCSIRIVHIWLYHIIMLSCLLIVFSHVWP